MNLPLFLLTGVSLSMDAFAIAIGIGAADMYMPNRRILRVGLMFGGFQALMPILGFWVGGGLAVVVSPYDRLLAFGLMAILGIKMIYDAWKHPHEQKRGASIGPSLIMLVMMAVTTSIDAFCVGVSFALMTENVYCAAPVIGGVTFAISYAGVVIGKKLGALFTRFSGFAGGTILILIGVRTLVF